QARRHSGGKANDVRDGDVAPPPTKETERRGDGELHKYRVRKTVLHHSGVRLWDREIEPNDPGSDVRRSENDDVKRQKDEDASTRDATQKRFEKRAIFFHHPEGSEVI